MIIFNAKKCPVCDTKYKKNAQFHELRLETAEGIHTVEICDGCAIFFDKSAEVLMKRGPSESEEEE